MSKSSLAKLSCMFTVGLIAAVAVPFTGSAQVSIISEGTTNGAPTTVIPPTTINGKITHFIEGGAKSQNSNNLFHTFTRFDLLRGEAAFFRDGANSPVNPGVQNVIARVTDFPTVIDGLVDTKTGYPNAHFYLLSPNGISLGSNAQFNVLNYAYLTTANVIKFADGNAFSAASRGNQTLSIAPVASFGFTGATIGTIGLDRGATLTVDPFTTVAFLGGRIILGDNATVKASADNARFEFVTVAGARDIGIREAVPGYDLQSTFGFGDRNSIIVGNNVTINPGPSGILRLGDSGPPEHTGPPGFITAGETVYNTRTTAFGWNFFQTSPATVSLSPSLSSVEAGNGGTLAVSLNGTTANSMTVGLTSDKPGVASLVTPSVIIGTGKSSETTSFTTSQVGTATITASLPPSTNAIATIQVNPVSNVSVLLSPLTIFQNTTGVLTVTLSKPAPENTPVHLRSLNPSVLTVPDTVVVNSGLQSQSFLVKGLTTGTATVTAQSGSSTASNVVQVTPFVIPTTATQVKGGNENQSQSATVAPALFYTNRLALNTDRCSAGKAGDFSSFVQRGRDRIPFQPGQFLSSPSVLDEDPSELGALPVRPAVIASAHARILNLAPNIASFLEPNQGC